MGAICAMVALVASCGGGGGGGGAAGGAGGGGGATSTLSPTDQFAADYAEAVCNAIASCCAVAGATAQSAECKDTLRQRIADQAAKAAELGVALVAGATAECIQQTAAATALCTAPFDQAMRAVEALGRAERACEDVFPGTKAVGEPCSSDLECASGESVKRACRLNSTATENVCLPVSIQVVVGKGASCVSDQCGGAEALYCDGSDVCVPYAPAGASCSADWVECESGLCSNGKCQNGKAQVGQPCGGPSCPASTPGGACFCVVGADCDHFASGGPTCVVANRKYGDACSDAERCDPAVVPYLACAHGKCMVEDHANSMRSYCSK